MASTDFLSASRTVHALDPQTAPAGAAIDGASIDTKGWRWAVVSVSSGAAASDHVIDVRQSADNVTFTDIPADSNAATTSDGTNSAAQFVLASAPSATIRGAIDLEQMDRYLRVSVSGGAAAGDMAVTVVLYGCKNTNEYIDTSVGGVDEIMFTVLTDKPSQ